MIRATTILMMLLLGATNAAAQGVASVALTDTSPISAVRAYVAAFNTKTLDAMMAHVAPGMVWLNVAGDSTTHERTRWSAPTAGEGGQSSVVVYEVRAGLLHRVWYYPAEP